MSTLHGLKIRLERSKDIPCGVCGTTTAAIGQDNDLRCAACGRRRGRLPATISNFLTAAISEFGRPSTAIIIKDWRARRCPARPGQPATALGEGNEQ